MAQVIRVGTVEWVEGVNQKFETDKSAQRIKVKLPGEDNVDLQDLPYCYPLLPKTLLTVPHKGEKALIILAHTTNLASTRYYIGPVIGQPQDFDHCAASYSERDKPRNVISALEDPAKHPEFEGCFPKNNETALVGRDSEDVTLKRGEIDIRCGIREERMDGQGFGYVMFNKDNHPAYIQLKYQRNLINNGKETANSVINLVADKINLVSHKDIANKQDSDIDLTDKKTLINNQENLIRNLHPLMKGDDLADALNDLKNAFLRHTHQYAMAHCPPCIYDLSKKVDETDFREFLSDNINIS